MLVKNSAILDTETGGLARGSVLHEAAILDIESRTIREFIVRGGAQVVTTKTGAWQDQVSMTTSSADVHIGREFLSNRDALTAQMLIQYGEKTKVEQQLKKLEKGIERERLWGIAESLMQKHEPWLAKQIERHPHLLDQVAPRATIESRRRSFAAKGYRFTTQDVTTRELLSEVLPEALKGKTVWIANAAFECLAGDTLIQKPNGDIIEIVDLEAPAEILGTAPEGKPTRSVKIVNAQPRVSKGIKAAKEIRPVYGLPTKASLGHLWLTDKGWKKTEDLTTEDWLLTSVKEFSPPVSGEFSDAELELIGWFIAEGKHEKAFSSKLLTLSNQELAIVLRCMYDADGHVAADSVIYTTTSKKLAYQLVLVLQRYGIWSRLDQVEDSRQERYKTCYRVDIPAEACQIFRDKIGFTSRKANELDEMLARHAESKQRVSTRRVPVGLVPGLLERWKEFARTLIKIPSGRFPYKRLLKQYTNSNTDGVYDGNSKSWSEESYNQICFLAEVEPLDGLIWTPISKIEDIEDIEVWDIETDTHEFLANGLVVHNSKQLGAHAAAMGLDELRSLPESRSLISPDAFYVTGKEVNIARTRALITGDWTEVYEAYLKTASDSGTKVRDILDVVRSVGSYGEKLGLVDERPLRGISIDIQARVLSSLEDASALLISELHQAAEDVTDEEKVLRKSDELARAMREVSLGTDLGKQYLEQDRRGEGPLAQIRKYFARMQAIKPIIDEQAIKQRLARAYQDFSTQDHTVQTHGFKTMMNIKVDTPYGVDVFKIPKHNKIRFENIEDLLSHIGDDYVDSDRAREIALEIHQELKAKGIIEGSLNEFSIRDRKALHAYGAAYAVEAQEETIRQLEARASEILSAKPVQRSIRTSPAQSAFLDALSEFSKGGVVKKTAVGMAAISLMGLLVAKKHEPPEQLNLVSYNYSDWERYQQAPEEPLVGMQETGLAAALRKMNTDFGSPYRGPVVSNEILVNQELLREREKWMRERFGVQHFDSEIGIFGRNGPFANFGSRPGYRFIEGGESVDAGNYGMRGDLRRINLAEGNWNIEVEDADTISIQRGGITGAISSFFGMNQKYSFRLAGIDSTETEHQGREAQPWAYQAKEALVDMVRSSESLEIVYDPQQNTYGRGLGALIADGENLNYTLVKRGIAAHLPYGKMEDAIINYSGMKKAEERAYQGSRGMWSQDWSRAFYEVSEAAGTRVTFNTLVNSERVAKSAALMNMTSFLDQAQASGYDSATAIAVGEDLARTEMEDDYSSIPSFNIYNAPHKTPRHEQALMVSSLDVTRGLDYGNPNTRQRGSYGELNSFSILDTMNTTTTVWNKRNYDTLRQYGWDSRARKRRQAEMQRHINSGMFASPIGHHRMQ